MVYEKVSPELNFIDREKEVEKFWKDNDVFKKSIENRKGGEVYTFYDGPPTANGKPHIGHVLTRVIKDMIPRYRTMKGYMVPRKAGWDTHGLPVELEVEKKLGLDGKEQIEEYGLEPFIKHCKESVWKYKGMWEDFSSTVGFWADMDNPYVTYENDFIEQKKKIITTLEVKDILVETIEINKIEERFFIEVYLKEDSKTSENVDIEKIQKVLEKAIGEKLMPNKTRTKKLNKQGKRVFCYLSEDKYILQIGQATKVKDNSSVSGDSLLQIRLNDGKYLIALSDGMGSGPEARKSSQIAIKMLERLLMSGFDKDTSIDLINTTIMNTNEEIFATLDIAIVDLYNGKIEFIKNGACPTYVKNKKKVQIVKSLSLPAGILKEINLTTYDKDIENNDIIVICSDGIIDSNIEYKNKELWVKYMLEDIATTNCQKIADMILNEAIDNNYGIAKDDMSIIVCKLTEKQR